MDDDRPMDGDHQRTDSRRESWEEVNRRLAKLERGMRWLVAKLSSNEVATPPLASPDVVAGTSRPPLRSVRTQARVTAAVEGQPTLDGFEKDSLGAVLADDRGTVHEPTTNAEDVFPPAPERDHVVEFPRRPPSDTLPNFDVRPAAQTALTDFDDRRLPVAPPILAEESAQPRASRRHGVPSWLVSGLVHAAVLLLLGLLSFALRERTRLELMATATESLDAVSDDAIVEFETHAAVETMDAALASAVDDPGEAAIGELSLDPGELLDEPWNEFGDYAAAMEEFGALGTTEAGSSTDGSGAAGSSSFFGARGDGSRVAFVVDGSNSMVGGRFETTLVEIARSVAALRSDQSFFVVVYSDMAYPMFHPQAVQEMIKATADNKRRLQAWLQTAEMCTGGRAAEALQMALNVRPHVVYLLSDGEMSQRAVRALVDLARPSVTLHTLGMTVGDANAAANLGRIAAAHRGTFSHVSVNRAARAMTGRRAIKRNRTRGTVWGLNLPPVELANSPR